MIEGLTKKIKCNNGQRFKIEGAEYILSGFRLNDKEYAILISLPSGNRFDEPTEVKDLNNLTHKELIELTNNEPTIIL